MSVFQASNVKDEQWAVLEPLLPIHLAIPLAWQPWLKLGT